MKDRLLKLLDAEQLTSSKFADVIGVQRSSVSHIISGRNKPSFDFLQKTLKAFPLIKSDWLILGQGSMYEGGKSESSTNLFNQPVSPATEPAKPLPGNDNTLNQEADLTSRESIIPEQTDKLPGKEQAYKDNNSSQNFPLEEPTAIEKKIRKIVILYDDNSFESYDRT